MDILCEILWGGVFWNEEALSDLWMIWNTYAGTYVILDPGTMQILYRTWIQNTKQDQLMKHFSTAAEK